MLPKTKNLKYPFENEEALSEGGKTISKLLGKYNPEKYMIATDKPEMRKYIFKNYVNVPTLRIGHNFFILDLFTSNSEKAAHLLRLKKIEILAKGTKKKKTITKEEDKQKIIIQSFENLEKKRKIENISDNESLSSNEDEKEEKEDKKIKQKKKKRKY